MADLLRGADVLLGIERLLTPCLLLDYDRMQRNITRLHSRLDVLGVPLRPHLKTSKCIEVARFIMPTLGGPATVSTLKEAEEFGAHGVNDILYAVGIGAAKLPRVVELQRGGVSVSVVLDSCEQAEQVVLACNDSRKKIPVLIEIDSDGHRAGIRPDSPLLVEIGQILHRGGANLRGVMTHAGGSYEHNGIEAHVAAAEQERAAAVDSANNLRSANLPCQVVSVGSTPTAHFARTLSGVTEVRAGVFVFMDLTMVGLNVCAVDNIALSVLTTVIAQRRDQGRIIVDAGWMAMSQDRGTAYLESGYGIVCDLEGYPYPDLILSNVNQEHGILSIRKSVNAELPHLPIGSLVRILPNHACATAAQFDCYHVIRDRTATTEIWKRFSGW